MHANIVPLAWDKFPRVHVPLQVPRALRSNTTVGEAAARASHLMPPGSVSVVPSWRRILVVATLAVAKPITEPHVPMAPEGRTTAV